MARNFILLPILVAATLNCLPADAQIPFSLIISEQLRSTFTLVGSGARAAGMGGAFTAVADDATAASFNPAGLAQLVIPEASLVFDRIYLEDGYRDFLLNPVVDIRQKNDQSGGIRVYSGSLAIGATQRLLLGITVNRWKGEWKFVSLNSETPFPTNSFLNRLIHIIFVKPVKSADEVVKRCGDS